MEKIFVVLYVLIQTSLSVTISGGSYVGTS